MFGRIVEISADRLDYPTVPITEMRYSAGRLVFVGIPTEMTSAVMVIQPPTGDPMVLNIDLEEESIDLPNGCNETVGTGDYWIYGFIGTTIYGLGTGKYTVRDAPTLAAAGTVTAVGNNTWIYNPNTQLYYKLTATSVDGVVSIDVAQEGVVSHD